MTLIAMLEHSTVASWDAGNGLAAAAARALLLPTDTQTLLPELLGTGGVKTLKTTACYQSLSQIANLDFDVTTEQITQVPIIK